MPILISLISSAILFFFSSKVLAYPDFISYGYRACMLCHYTGSGGGALNDYGKAVFASELTARTFTNKTPDEMGESSGFLGSKELPWWFRPGIKYRGLWFRRNVWDSNKSDRSLSMQFDVDLVFKFDPREKYILVTNLGYIPTPSRFKTSSDPDPSNAIFRQFYLRAMVGKGVYVYGGLFDKFYGIKHADHTAFNRGDISMGMSDQTHGAAIQYQTSKFDFAAHAFLGNLNQESEIRQKGFSFTTEYFLSEFATVGASVLSSESNYKSEKRFALLSRLGFDKGKSFFIETGYKQDETVKQTGPNVINEKGAYTYMQSLVEYAQGYNFLTTYQYKKPNLSSSQSNEVNRLGIGLLLFPMMRTELRGELVNTRTTAPESTSPDEWSLVSQVHFSW